MKEKQFAVCVNNEGYKVSLERRKLYRVIPDKEAAKKDLVRVVDESGQSYLYPENCFIAVKLSQTTLKALDIAA